MNIRRFFNKWNLWILLVLLLAIGLRFYKFEDKENLFLDEYLSVVISTVNEKSLFVGIKDDSTSFTGREVKSILLSADNSLSGILNDIKSLRHTTRDSPHTNLYYSLFRLSLAGADNSDIAQVMWRGFILNLAFFILSFILLYKLASELFSEKLLILGLLIVAFLNPASVGGTLFLRPYQLQETIFILMSYLFILCCIRMMRGEKIDSWPNLLFLSFVTALTFLSGYFAIFYVFLLGCALLFYSYKYSEKRNILFFVAVLGLSYIFVLIMYLSYNQGLFMERGEEALGKLSIAGLSDNLRLSLSGILNEISEYFLSILEIVLLLIVFAYIMIAKLYKKRRNVFLKPLSVLFVCAFLWMLIVVFLAPMKVIRYIVPVFPIILLLVPCLLFYLDSKKQIFLCLLFSILMLGKTISTNVNWGVIPIEAEYINDGDIPLVLGGSESVCQIGAIPRFTDERPVEFSFSPNTFQEKVGKYDEVYILIANNMEGKYVIPDGYGIEGNIKRNHLFIFCKLRKIK